MTWDSLHILSVAFGRLGFLVARAHNTAEESILRGMMTRETVLALLDETDCCGKGCGTDESKACLRCCRTMLANYAANHGARCDREQLRLSEMANAALNKLAAAQAENERLRDALTKISAIRDSIVGMQGFNFSEHAYPLVAVLDGVGFKGAGYEISRRNLGTLIEQLAAMTAARAEACNELEDTGGERANARAVELRKVGSR